MLHDNARELVTVVLLTKNEEANISGAVASVREYFPRIVVVDSSSVDGTAEIAEQMGAEVLNFVWDGGHPKKKQWALENAIPEGTYALYLDADERLDHRLATEIVAHLQTGVDALIVSLDYHFGGRRLRFGKRPKKMIVLRSGHCRFPKEAASGPHDWEVEGHYQPEVDGVVKTCRARLTHADEDPLFDWFARHNRYSDWLAFGAALPEATSRGRALWNRLPLKGAIAFLHSYVLRLGFLDGWAGFDYATGLAHYYWQGAAKRREIARRGTGA